MGYQMTLRRLSIYLALVLVAAVTAVFFVALRPDPKVAEGFRMEVLKHLLDLIVVVLIGGVITALFKASEYNRDSVAKAREETSLRARLRAQVQEDYLRRLGVQYRSVKASRRTLVAAGITGKRLDVGILDAAQVGVLESEMKNINKAQLELEGMQIESKHLPTFVGVGDLKSPLHVMERYLRELLSEYEKWMPELRAGAKIPFPTLEKLIEFTGATRQVGRGFLKSFALPHEEVVLMISRAIAFGLGDSAMPNALRNDTQTGL
jgi:hypothetical protein